MYKKNELVLVGAIISAHGIKGNILVRSFMEPPQSIFHLELLIEEKHTIKLRLISAKSHNRFICQVLNGINNLYISSCNEAELLAKKQLFIIQSTLPLLEEHQFYTHHLINLSVVDMNLEHIGYVSQIFNFGASDILEIEFKDQKTKLVPFTKSIFPIIKDDHIVMNQSHWNV